MRLQPSSRRSAIKKTPSLFERDWTGNPERVTRVPNPEAKWVFDGEGTPYRKLDGTCCLIQDGKLFKRYEVKKGKTRPDDFIPCEDDPITGKVMGWRPITDFDYWHIEAWDRLRANIPPAHGTYELCGPKIQGNPECYEYHTLIKHDSAHLIVDIVPRDYDGLLDYFQGRDMEGVVWHHPDGRMVKIKLKDFGLKR